MAREIKFKVWDKKLNCWMGDGEVIFSDYGDTRLKANPNSIEYIGDETHNYYEESRWVILQYTGLKDKNGNEIYEGDILRVDFVHASWWFYQNPQPTGRDGYSSSQGLCTVKWPYNIDLLMFPEKDFWFETYPTLEKEFNSRLKGTKIDNSRALVFGNIYSNPELVTRAVGV